jgi:hypothetical protein
LSLSLSLFLYLSIYLYIYLSNYLYIYLCIYLFTIYICPKIATTLLGLIGEEPPRITTRT